MEQTAQAPVFSPEIMDALQCWLTDNHYAFVAAPAEGFFCLYTTQCGNNKQLPIWVYITPDGFEVTTRYDLCVDPCDQEVFDRTARFLHYLNDLLADGHFQLTPSTGTISHINYVNCKGGFPSDEVILDGLWKGITRYEKVDSSLQHVILEDLSDQDLQKFCGYPLPFYRVLWNKLTAKRSRKK